jgi:hypothetical protein
VRKLQKFQDASGPACQPAQAEARAPIVRSAFVNGGKSRCEIGGFINVYPDGASGSSAKLSFQLVYSKSEFPAVSFKWPLALRKLPVECVNLVSDGMKFGGNGRLRSPSDRDRPVPSLRV